MQLGQGPGHAFQLIKGILCKDELPLRTGQAWLGDERCEVERLGCSRAPENFHTLLLARSASTAASKS
jgi:hypothetical protein